mgnify:CR=1 FL=1
MVDDDQTGEGPSLEAPTLGLGKLFGRGRAEKKQAPADAPTTQAAEPVQEPVQEPAPEPEAATEPQPVVEETPEAEQTRAIPVQTEAPAYEPEPVPEPAPAPLATMLEEQPVAAAPAQEPTEEPIEQRGPRIVMPPMSGRLASTVTGLLVGLLVVVLTAGSLQACEAARGVATCGGGPGFALLVTVMATMVLLGGLMLRLAKVPDPTSTAFLAVGLLCVFALLFLVESLDSLWMIVVIPVVSVATFVLSHWVTTSVIDQD